MSENLRWIAGRPWIVHAASFVIMVAAACPRYRVVGETSIGWLGYSLDSLILALQHPATILHLLTRERLPAVITISTVWALALWPLLFTRRRRGLILSYLTLIPLWLSYAVSWVFTQTWTGH